MTKTARKRIEQRRRLIEKLGGKCSICGYAKNLASLDFHHRDPKDKYAAVGHLINFHKFSEAEIEAAKCDILCRNCHGEHHNPKLAIINSTEGLEFIDEDLRLINKTCANCLGYSGGMLFCSPKCAQLASRKIKNRPTKIELKRMIEKLSFCAIGRKYGVSDNAVRKWVRTYDLKN